MNAAPNQQGRIRSSRTQRGSVLIIVMWTCLGLVALTLYFAGSMTSELRAADNRVNDVAARQAAVGGMRYAGYVLGQYAKNGRVPLPEEYRAEELPVGDATFWFVGRDLNQRPTGDPVFGLVDEASKLNLNTATRGMLELLPNITPELVDAILSWKSRNQAGAGDSTYGRLDPPRLNKAAPFESVDELRLVYGATLDLLIGEDTNRTGALDDNENDGDQSAPRDNSDGLIQPGILEYVTVYTRQPNTRSTGGKRFNVTTLGTPQGKAQLTQLMRQRGITQDRIQSIINRMPNEPQRIGSVAEFVKTGRLTSDEYLAIRLDISASNGTVVQGLININTASETVLACIPGIGMDNASMLVAYRLSHTNELNSLFWVTELLSTNSIRRAGPYLTDQSYQFSADVAAVGTGGRGYCREKTIFDMTRGTPRIIYHQDLTPYGWALGVQVRQTFIDAKENRT
jgi:type II secretory pathway component PulK